jgi:hypothetical protein
MGDRGDGGGDDFLRRREYPSGRRKFVAKPGESDHRGMANLALAMPGRLPRAYDHQQLQSGHLVCGGPVGGARRDAGVPGSFKLKK